MCKICGLEHRVGADGLSRRRFMLSTGAVATASIWASAGWAKDTGPAPKPQNVVSPDQALDLLQKGNRRYVEGVSRRHDFQHEREALSAGQNPYAGILSCADSRVAPEYAFDSGRGDLFVCRVAGNFANDDTIASFEYAVAHLGVPLILVLGHDACGAVDAALKSVKDNVTLPGHLPSLIAKLAPAIEASAGEPGDPLENAIRRNVVNTAAALKSAAPILATAADQQKIKIVGGIYRLSTGHVDLVT